MKLWNVLLFSWTYSTEQELDGSSDWGTLAKYGGGGYYQDLPPLKADAAQVLQELKDGLWVDRGTRAIFIDFTVYNANINLFCVITLVEALTCLNFEAFNGVRHYMHNEMKIWMKVTSFQKSVKNSKLLSFSQYGLELDATQEYLT